MTPKKTPPRLATANLADYQESIDWLKSTLVRQGLKPVRAQLEPSLEVWQFYDADGVFLVSVPHVLVEEVMARLWERARKSHGESR